MLLVARKTFFQNSSREVAATKTESNGQTKHQSAENDRECNQDGFTAEADLFERHGNSQKNDYDTNRFAEHPRRGKSGVHYGEKGSAGKKVCSEHANEQNQKRDKYLGQEANEAGDLLLQTHNPQHADAHHDEAQPNDPENRATEQFGHGRKIGFTKQP